MGLMAVHDAERCLSMGLLCLPRVACPHNGQMLGHSMVHKALGETFYLCIWRAHCYKLSIHELSILENRRDQKLRL